MVKCGLPREEFFVTTKVWISNAGYEKAKASIAESLKKLQTDYIDLLLIHQPFGDYYGTYRAMEEAYKEGKNDYFNNPVLKKIGEKYKKSVAQVALRFLLQSDVVLIPKSTHKNRMEENFSIFDFALDAEDMKEIEALDTGKSLFFSHYDPETVEWFMTMA